MYADEVLRQAGVHLLPEPPGFAATRWANEIRYDGRQQAVRFDPASPNSIVIAQVTEKTSEGGLTTVNYTVLTQGEGHPAEIGSARHKDNPDTAMSNAKTLADNLLITAGWRLE